MRVGRREAAGAQVYQDAVTLVPTAPGHSGFYSKCLAACADSTYAANQEPGTWQGNLHHRLRSTSALLLQQATLPTAEHRTSAMPYVNNTSSGVIDKMYVAFEAVRSKLLK